MKVDPLVDNVNMGRQVDVVNKQRELDTAIAGVALDHVGRGSGVGLGQQRL
jgi:hypothetical protein